MSVNLKGKGGLNEVLVPVKRALLLLQAVLREVFDEAAYERFLDQRQLPSSPDAYSCFCRERDQSRARRPRCC